MRAQKTAVFFIFLATAAIAGGLFAYFNSIRETKVSRIVPQTARAGDAEAPEAEFAPLLKIGFDETSRLEDWTIHHFRPGGQAEIRQDEAGDWMIDIQSHGDATLFLKEAPAAMETRPRVSWQWRIEQFPFGKSYKEFAGKGETDFGARFYVVFEGLVPAFQEVIQYIWDDHFPEGTWRPMPNFSHIKMIVIRQSDGADGVWHSEQRDVYADYEMLFGKRPTKAVQAIGLLVDSDNTGTTARAQFKDIVVSVPREKVAEAAVAGQAASKIHLNWFKGVNGVVERIWNPLWERARSIIRRW